jgi:GR25 family glycosyltransferase involved in LPS biosynthesis
MFENQAFNNIKKQRIVAVDGKAKNIESILQQKLKGYDLKQHTRVEYACLLSHINAIEEFNKSDNKVALIIEDDMNLDFQKYWKKTTRQIMNNAPKDWEIIQLNYNTDKILKNDYTINKGDIYSTGAYIINKNNKNLIKTGKCNLSQAEYHSADAFLFNFYNTFTYKYPMFTYALNETSTIHNDHIDMHNESRIKIETMLENYQ